MNLPKHLEKDVLCQVLREAGISSHSKAKPINTSAMCLIDLFKGRFIALLCQADIFCRAPFCGGRLPLTFLRDRSGQNRYQCRNTWLAQGCCHKVTSSNRRGRPNNASLVAVANRLGALLRRTSNTREVGRKLCHQGVKCVSSVGKFSQPR